MQDLESATIQCPYCGEYIEVFVDCSVESQEYIEDCRVCCRPITLVVEASPEAIISIAARTEND